MIRGVRVSAASCRIGAASAVSRSKKNGVDASGQMTTAAPASIACRVRSRWRLRIRSR
jgi:hypothetical protein